ncbi:MAG TPA: glucans biosynthesis glucosyltransferase MdoH [Myxococcota bacterium]|nr:glucans biosynthesis glucosyltransferase MdoH [Myxococcota bacterium]
MSPSLGEWRRRLDAEREAERSRTPPPLDRLLLDWRGALARAVSYLGTLGLEASERERLGREAVERALGEAQGASAISGTLDATEEVLPLHWPLDGAAASQDSFAAWRLAAWQAGGLPQPNTPLAPPRPLEATPPLLRGPMVPEVYRGRRIGEWRTRRRRDADRSRAVLAPVRPESPRWRRRGRLRRVLLALLVIVPSIAAGAFMLEVLPGRGEGSLELVLSFFFGALFGWLSIGFWTALFGFLVMLRRGDRFAIHRPNAPSEAPIDPVGRTALVMPICDEPVERVFAGLRAVWASLARTGEQRHFDCFVLSDSAQPATWVDEEEAFTAWRREAPGPGHLYYRRRRVRRKRKSGNIADFCRRFGRRYRYMIVLDADSVMSGAAIVQLVRLMEERSDVGVIQTAPAVVRARSLFARMQQFAARLYGPMFAAGMHFWQLGDSPFWGHNAILRVAPFMAHCGLPRLSGKPPLGGDILSHDFVEAALLGRAGFSVWLAFDLPGSYEETPETLLEEMKRDRRWCQGNLQHLRLLFTGGVYATHRALFLNGVFSYVSALLWLGFLVASTAEALLWALRGPDYFPKGPSLFPTWPVWRPEWAMSLVGVVAFVLFLPKILAVALAVGRRQSAGFGGLGPLFASVVLETLATALLAPIRMAFYCRFVLSNLVGRAVSWQGGSDEEETSWGQALRRHGPDALVASVWAYTVYVLHPQAFFWLIPVAAALIVSVPLSVWASRRKLGDRARAAHIFLTPEERVPPPEIRELEAGMRRLHAAAARRPDGLTRAVVDPRVNALHDAMLRGPRKLGARLRAARDALARSAAAKGPDALTPAERRTLLSDAGCLREAHEAVWRLDDPEAAHRWGL